MSEARWPTNHGSGAFTGDLTARLRDLCEEARAWASDVTPAVSRWARRRIRDLDAELTRAEHLGLDHW